MYLKNGQNRIVRSHKEKKRLIHKLDNRSNIKDKATQNIQDVHNQNQDSKMAELASRGTKIHQSCTRNQNKQASRYLQNESK